MPYSAVLLAGGKSTRMGRDKATILVDGVPLWQRQLTTLRATGAAEIFISGKGTGPYAGSGVEVVSDHRENAGPLGGICAALLRCTTPWCLVLAVDMPWMTATYLRSLAQQAEHAGNGFVPRNASGQWEPLAAVYPRAAAISAEFCLLKGMVRMTEFVEDLKERGFIEARSFPTEDQQLFENWNAPSDLPGA